MNNVLVFEILIAPIRNNAILVIVALAFTLLDFLLGFAGAVIRGEVSSKVLRQGIGHKLASIAFIIAADLLDAVIGTGKLIGVEPVMVVACTYLVLMEVISVLENIRKMNPDLSDNPLEHTAEEIKQRIQPEAEHDERLYFTAEDAEKLNQILPHIDEPKE
jgi:phage-related holin